MSGRVQTGGLDIRRKGWFRVDTEAGGGGQRSSSAIEMVSLLAGLGHLVS